MHIKKKIALIYTAIVLSILLMAGRWACNEIHDSYGTFLEE